MSDLIWYRAKRAGWNETLADTVTNVDILDPYDYENDDIEGELVIRLINTEWVGPHTQYLVGGQCADPDTIEKIT